jgi:phosphoglycerate kinase
MIKIYKLLRLSYTQNKRGEMKFRSISRFNLRNKTVLLRTDYNVPIKSNKVIDNEKIKSSLETIHFLLHQNCKVVILTHLGRPNGKVVQGLKLNAILKELKSLLPKEKITKLDDCIGKEIKNKIKNARSKQIFLLENVRFYKEEENNHPAFAHSLADLADVYVNDAFSVSHRKHASLEAITHFLPSYGGFSLEKEISHLNKALKASKPRVWIVGGAKLDKTDFMLQALKKADKVLIGGALGFPFLKAKGYQIGQSKINSTSVTNAKKILKKWSSKKLVFPIDFLVTNRLSPMAKVEERNYNQIGTHEIALDIGPKTIELFKKYLNKSKTVVWNGPLGYTEWANFSKGTKEIGRFLGKVKAFKLVGGGETSEAIHKFHLTHNFTYVSSSGGATIMYLSGKELPAIKALERNYKKNFKS